MFGLNQIKDLQSLELVLNYYGLKLDKNKKVKCPFHSDKTASLSISLYKGKAMWKCFGCSASGDVIDFIKRKEGVDYHSAIQIAYNILGLDSSELKQGNNKLDKTLNYLKRELTQGKTVFKYENHYIYTDINNKPKIIKVKYRANTKEKTFRTYGLVEEEYKYRLIYKDELANAPKMIYNLPRVVEAIKNNKPIFFVEGEKDADTLSKMGFVATTILQCGTWCDNYTSQLEGSNIIAIGDNDKVGKQYINNWFNCLEGHIKSFKIVTLPGIELLGDKADISDWIQAKHTKAELLEAVKNSFDRFNYYKWVDTQTVQREHKQVEVPLMTIGNFELILKRTGIKASFNEITRKITQETTYFNNISPNTLITEIQSYCSTIGFKCNENDVVRWLNVVAYKNSINPFKNWLDNLDKWDRTPRLEEYCSYFKTTESFDDNLKQVLIKKWLLHFIASAYSPDFKSQGILVLKGKQGIYKTTSMSYLIPIQEPWVFLSEQKFVDSRDGIQNITEHQLVELSEFARSAKEIDALKGFVTAPYDRYRKAYDRESTTFKRRTVYYATINDDEFLLDDENRRFWVIDLESINLEGIKTFNYEQLWAELYHIWHVQGNHEYYLNQEELSLLNTSNDNFKFKTELEGQLELAFDFGSNSNKKIWLSNAEIMSFLSKTVSPSVLSRTLNKMNIKKERKKGKGFKDNQYYLMPLPRYWKGQVEPKYKHRLDSYVELKLIKNDTSSTDTKTNEQLIAENKRLKESMEISDRLYKDQIIKLEKEIAELKEIIDYWENTFNELKKDDKPKGFIE